VNRSGCPSSPVRSFLFTGRIGLDAFSEPTPFPALAPSPAPTEGRPPPVWSRASRAILYSCAHHPSRGRANHTQTGCYTRVRPTPGQSRSRGVKRNVARRCALTKASRSSGAATAHCRPARLSSRATARPRQLPSVGADALPGITRSEPQLRLGHVRLRTLPHRPHGGITRPSLSTDYRSL